MDDLPIRSLVLFHKTVVYEGEPVPNGFFFSRHYKSPFIILPYITDRQRFLILYYKGSEWQADI